MSDSTEQAKQPVEESVQKHENPPSKERIDVSEADKAERVADDEQRGDS